MWLGAFRCSGGVGAGFLEFGSDSVRPKSLAVWPADAAKENPDPPEMGFVFQLPEKIADHVGASIENPGAAIGHFDQQAPQGRE